MLTFFKPGYAKHPQCFSRISSINILVFLFFILSLQSISAASCNDNDCYLGHDNITLSWEYSGSDTETAVITSQEFNLTLDSTDFFIKIISVDREDLEVKFLVNSSPIINDSQITLELGENTSLKGLEINLTNLVTNLENEQVLCPEDCFNGTFKYVDETFDLGVSLCKKNYEFLEEDQENNNITIKKGDELYILNYDPDTTNVLGDLITLETEVDGHDLEFDLRYNENGSFLYLVDEFLACPIVELCGANTDCDDADACTLDECQLTECTYDRVGYCRSGDGCCPATCDLTNDGDCLPIGYTANAQCDDSDPCTIDLLLGNTTACTNLAVTSCIDDDMCCPGSCDEGTDTDCSGGLSDEPCVTDDDCDDFDDCSIDECVDDFCSYSGIDACLSDDSCCPEGCSYSLDSDCSETVECGDGVCNGDETSDSCCSDCSCETGFECQEDACVDIEKSQIESLVNKYEEFISQQEDLFSKDFTFNEKLFLRSGNGYTFEYSYLRGTQEEFIEGTIDENGEIVLLSSKKPNILQTFIYLVLIIPIILGGIMISKDIVKKNKERYYKKLLQQKYGAGMNSQATLNSFPQQPTFQQPLQSPQKPKVHHSLKDLFHFPMHKKPPQQPVQQQPIQTPATHHPYPGVQQTTLHRFHPHNLTPPGHYTPNHPNLQTTSHPVFAKKPPIHHQTIKRTKLKHQHTTIKQPKPDALSQLQQKTKDKKNELFNRLKHMSKK